MVYPLQDEIVFYIEFYWLQAIVSLLVSIIPYILFYIFLYILAHQQNVSMSNVRYDGTTDLLRNISWLPTIHIHKSELKNQHNLISIYLSHQPPPSFFHPTLLPANPLFKNAKLTIIHVLLLKIHSTKMTYEKRDHPNDIFLVPYSVFHTPDPAYGSCLIIAFGRFYLLGGYVICFIRPWVSIQSVFFLSHTLYLPIPLYLNLIQVTFNVIPHLHPQNEDWSSSPGTLFTF